MKKWVVANVILILAAVLSACGQKGPLYLPGHPPPSQQQINRQDINQKVDENLDAVE